MFNALMDTGIVLELSDSNIAMAMTGIGNTKEDYEKLLRALKELPKKEMIAKCKAVEVCETNEYNEDKRDDDSEPMPENAKELIRNLKGTVARQAIIPYPPGIPLVAAGEVITEEIILEAVKLRLRGHKVIGVDF